MIFSHPKLFRIITISDVLKSAILSIGLNYLNLFFTRLANLHKLLISSFVVQTHPSSVLFPLKSLLNIYFRVPHFQSCLFCFIQCPRFLPYVLSCIVLSLLLRNIFIYLYYLQSSYKCIS